MDSEKLKDEYISAFEEKKALEHQNLILLDKQTKLEPLEAKLKEALIQLDSLTEKNIELNNEVFYLKDRLKQIGNENVELISLNNQYIEAIKAFHSETGSKQTKIILENSRIKTLEKDLAISKKTVCDLEKLIDEMNEKYIAEQEERFYVEKQYEDFIYEKENELANLRFENQKILKENLLEKFFDMKKTPNKFDFFYNEETDKIEIFVNDEKIVDIDNSKPLLDDDLNENFNNADYNQNNGTQNNNLNEVQNDVSIKSTNSSFINLIKRKYSVDVLENKKKRLLSDLSFSNLDIDYAYEGKNNNLQQPKNFDLKENTEILNSISTNIIENKSENDNLNNKEEFNKNQTEALEEEQKILTPRKKILIGSEFSCKKVCSSFNPADIQNFEFETPKKSSGFLFIQTPSNNENVFNYISPGFINNTNEALDLNNPSNMKESKQFDNLESAVSKNNLTKKKIKSLNSLNKIKSVALFNKKHKNSKSISFALLKNKGIKEGLKLENNVNELKANVIVNCEASPILIKNSGSIKDKFASKKCTKGKSINIRASQGSLGKRNTLAFHSTVNSQNFFNNVKKKLYNSNQVQNFVLENLDLEENEAENKHEYFGAEAANSNQNNNDLNTNNFYNNNNLDNPLFKSANSSFLNDTSFNSKAVIRRTTIDNYNMISNKLSAITVNSNTNNLNYNYNINFEKEEEDQGEESEKSNDYSIDNNKQSNKNLNSNEKNFILEDLIEEQTLIAEENFPKENQRRKIISDANSLKDESENSIDYNANVSFCFAEENKETEKNVMIDVFEDLEEQKPFEALLQFSPESKITNSFAIGKETEIIVDDSNLKKEETLHLKKTQNEKNKISEQNQEKNFKKKTHKRSSSNQNFGSNNLNLLKTTSKNFKKKKAAETKENSNSKAKNENEFSELKFVIKDKDNIIIESDDNSCSSRKNSKEEEAEADKKLLSREKQTKSNKIFNTNSIKYNYNYSNNNNSKEKTIFKNNKNIQSSKLLKTINSTKSFGKLNTFDSDFKLFKNFKKKIKADNSGKTELKTTNFKSPNDNNNCNYNNNSKENLFAEFSQIKFSEKTEEIKKNLLISSKSKFNFLSSNALNTNSLKKFNKNEGFIPIRRFIEGENQEAVQIKNEVEKCIRNIDLKTFLLNNRNLHQEEKESNNIYKSSSGYEKRFDNSDLKQPQKTHEEFKQFKDAEVSGDRILNENEKLNFNNLNNCKNNFSTNNITNNNHFWKYKINLAYGNEAFSKKTDADNNISNFINDDLRSADLKNLNNELTDKSYITTNRSDLHKDSNQNAFYNSEAPMLDEIQNNIELKAKAAEDFSNMQKLSYSNNLINKKINFRNNSASHLNISDKEKLYHNHNQEYYANHLAQNVINNHEALREEFKSKFSINHKIRSIRETFGLYLNQSSKLKIFNDLVVENQTNEFYVLSNKIEKVQKVSKIESLIKSKNNEIINIDEKIKRIIDKGKINSNKNNEKCSKNNKNISGMYSNVSSSDSDSENYAYGETLKNKLQNKINNEQSFEKDSIQFLKENKNNLVYENIKIDCEILNKKNAFNSFSVNNYDANKFTLNKCNQEDYVTEDLSMLSIENRKNILSNFCKDQEINLHTDSNLDNDEAEDKEKQKNKIIRMKIINRKLIDGKNNPLCKSKISYKNMTDENSNSEKRNKYNFESKSFIQDATILKEEQQGACKRCSIF